MPPGKGPDPSEFDPDFVIGEEDAPSRSITPRPKEKANATDSTEGEEKDKEDGKEQSTAEEEKPDSQPEIPPEIQTRLRKLDKLEPKYSGGTCSELLDRSFH